MIRRRNVRYDLESCVLVAGDYFATAEDMVIETVLGSCIAVCLFDHRNGVGGMNHFMLPANRNTDAKKGANSKEGRYGANAMELLINDMMRLGAARRNLHAKVFGGGNVTSNRSDTLRIGDWNTRFALNFLHTENIPIVSKDVGGSSGRRIVMFTRTGNVKLRRLASSEADSVARKEMWYRSRLVRRLPEDSVGDVTLFE